MSVSYEVEKDYVYKVQSIKTPSSTATVKYIYCPYLKIELYADKSEIVANGEDKAVIEVTVKTWDDQDVTDFDRDLVFDINGTQSVVTSQNGNATFEFKTDAVGEYKVTVSGDQTVIESAEITITSV